MIVAEDIRAMAEQTIILESIADIQLTNLARRIAIAELNHNGFYACTIAGVKTLFLLEGVTT